jgi:hypothetical protein
MADLMEEAISGVAIGAEAVKTMTSYYMVLKDPKA